MSVVPPPGVINSTPLLVVRGVIPGPGPPFASGINATRKRETLRNNLLREQRGPGVVFNDSQLHPPPRRFLPLVRNPSPPWGIRYTNFPWYRRLIGRN